MASTGEGGGLATAPTPLPCQPVACEGDLVAFGPYSHLCLSFSPYGFVLGIPLSFFLSLLARATVSFMQQQLPTHRAQAPVVLRVQRLADAATVIGVCSWCSRLTPFCHYQSAFGFSHYGDLNGCNQLNTGPGYFRAMRC